MYKFIWVSFDTHMTNLCTVFIYLSVINHTVVEVV